MARADRLPRPHHGVRGPHPRPRPGPARTAVARLRLPRGAGRLDPGHPALRVERRPVHEAVPRRRPGDRPHRHPPHPARRRPRAAGGPAHAAEHLDGRRGPRVRDQGRLALGGLRLLPGRRRQPDRARRAHRGHRPQRPARVGRLHRHRLRRGGRPGLRAHPGQGSGDRGGDPRAGAAGPGHPRLGPPGAGHGAAPWHRPGRGGGRARAHGGRAGGGPARPGGRRPGPPVAGPARGVPAPGGTRRHGRRTTRPNWTCAPCSPPTRAPA